VEENIEARADVDCCGTGFCVKRVNNPESGFQRATSDAGLEGLGSDVKDSSTSRFRASPSGSRNLMASSQLRGGLVYITRTGNQRA
jgi:hypothetical protein